MEKDAVPSNNDEIRLRCSGIDLTRHAVAGGIAGSGRGSSTGGSGRSNTCCGTSSLSSSFTATTVATESASLGRVGCRASLWLVVDDNGRSLSHHRHRLMVVVVVMAAATAIAVAVVAVLLTVVRSDTVGVRREFARLKLESGEVKLGYEEQVDEAKDGLGEDIKDTVEDHLGVGGNDIATVSETPTL